MTETHPPIPDARIAEFERFVRDVMESYDAAGAIVSIFGREITYYEQTFGWRDAERRLAITPDTLFGMASLTKSVTCVALLQLAERGIVDLQGLVSEVVPEFTGRHQKGVRVAHLMSHSAGFFPEARILARDVAERLGLLGPKDGPRAPGEDIAYSDALAREGVRLVAERLDGRTRLIGRPGELMSYSNDSYGLISDIIRRYGGEPSFAHYVVRHVLEPLGMHRSTLEFEKPRHDENCTRLYIHRNGLEGPREDAGRDFYDNAFVLMGGGALRSTVNDMKKYVRMLLAEGTGESGARILGRYWVREMRKPIQFYRHQQYYGCGLSTRFEDDITVVGHGGGMTGISNMMLFSPELEAGVLVFCNTSNVPVAEIAAAAMRLMNGRPPVRRFDFGDVPWTAETVEAACGTYRSGEGVRIELCRKGGGIGVTLDGAEQSVRTVGREMLVLPAPHTAADLILCRDTEGRIMGVRYGGRIVPREPAQA